MKLIISLILICTSFYFKADNIGDDNYAYYSDYFVFISDDSSNPIVIPMDFNWSTKKEGYEIEFKSWYGTKKNWPITYTKNSIKSDTKEIPQESFEHKNSNGFVFNSKENKITVKIPLSPKITLTIPKKEEWILAPAKSKIHKDIYASKTSIEIKGKKKIGWILYERIRWKKDEIIEFGDFEAFFWVPIIVNGNLYHFEQHRDEKIAYKWTKDSKKITVSTISDFNITIIKNTKDNKSGRKAIPKELQITAKNFNILLASKGQQVGYGKKYPKGLAYYRQSLLVSKKESKFNGYGMLELILEDN